MGRFLRRFPDYQLIGEPVRAPRARFRGFTQATVAVR